MWKKKVVLQVLLSALLFAMAIGMVYSIIKKKQDKEEPKIEVNSIHFKTDDGGLTYDLKNDSVYEIDSVEAAKKFEGIDTLYANE
jgi:hypothetical protein